MVKINIISIGNFKKNIEYQKLFEEYKKRIKWEVNLIELKNFSTDNIEHQKELEGKEIIKHINPNYKTIVLDEKGNIIKTDEFYNICKRYFINVGGINFIIGGSDGLSNLVINKADYILSLGKMVFPHLMVRIILIEQLYRVFTLDIGHPYHK